MRRADPAPGGLLADYEPAVTHVPALTRQLLDDSDPQLVRGSRGQLVLQPVSDGAAQRPAPLRAAASGQEQQHTVGVLLRHIVWQRQRRRGQPALAQEHADLLRFVLLADRTGDLLEGQATDQPPVVLGRIGQLLDDHAPAGAVLASDGEGEVPDRPQIRVRITVRVRWR